MIQRWRGLIALAILVAVISVLVGSQVKDRLTSDDSNRLPVVEQANSAPNTTENATTPADTVALAAPDQSQPQAVPPPVAPPASVTAKLSELQNALKADPQNADALTELGAMAFEARLFAQAADFFSDALEIRPDDARLLNDLGSAFLYQGMMSLAKKSYLQSMEIDETLPDPHFNLAIILSHGDPPDIPGALDEWTQVIEMAPSSDLAGASLEYIQSYSSENGAHSTVPAQ